MCIRDRVYADNHVVNVSYDGKVTTASGEAPTLPLKAKVTFYDGSEKEYNIAVSYTHLCIWSR